MITIESHIQRLLLDHDCVVLQGFGAFIAMRHPASISADGSMMLPPYRTLGFNPDVNHSDGLLASSISRREGISYDAASKEVSAAVGALRAQLESEGEVAISRVGKLIHTPTGQIEFIPAENQITTLPFAGFAPVPLINCENPATENGEETPTVVKVDIPAWKSIVRVAACFCLLVLTGLVCSTPKLVPDNQPAMASMMSSLASKDAPVASSIMSEQLYESTAPVLRLSMPSESDLGKETVDTNMIRYTRFLLARQKAKAEAREARAQLSRNVSAPLRLTATNGYGVVVASMKSLKGAEKFISAVGNSNLRILARDGRYRVIITTASTEDEAKAIASRPSMQSRFPGAWVTEL